MSEPVTTAEARIAAKQIETSNAVWLVPPIPSMLISLADQLDAAIKRGDKHLVSFTLTEQRLNEARSQLSYAQELRRNAEDERDAQAAEVARLTKELHDYRFHQDADLQRIYALAETSRDPSPPLISDYIHALRAHLAHAIAQREAALAKAGVRVSE
jgi:hypothetical protein